MNDIAIFINTCEITAGTRGASQGPEAILAEAEISGNANFKQHEIYTLPCFNHYLDTATPYNFAKRIDGVVELYKCLDHEISKALTKGTFPIILAGDHGSAGGTIAGIKTAFPSKRLGVVWIDAHADIHTPYTTPSGNIHGMPLATALGMDNLKCQSNDVDQHTIELWNELKNVGNISPKLNPEDLVYIAVRSTESAEDALISELGITNITVSELRENGAESVVESVNEKLSGCDMIYISFDVDSMDPILTSYETGTPVEDGLSPEEAKALLDGFAQNPKTVCIEIVEVNPSLGRDVRMMAKTVVGFASSIIENLKVKS